MALKELLAKKPRADLAKIYTLRSTREKLSENFRLYDRMLPQYINTIESMAFSSNFDIQYGDLVIDTTLENTIDDKKVTRNGIMIFDGSHLQYLDRTLNGSGTIPSNYPTFTQFPLGYWGNTFVDKIVWIEPTRDYQILGTKLITDKYQIIAKTETIEQLKELMQGTENIILYVPDLKTPVLQFDNYLIEIYQHRKKQGV